MNDDGCPNENPSVEDATGYSNEEEEAWRSPVSEMKSKIGKSGFERKESASMATKFTPLHDRILVRRIEEAGTTRGGLIIPDSAKDKPQEGEVISIGKGKINDEGKVFPLAVQQGDRILFGKYSGTEIKIDGEDLLIMKEEEVLGVISGAAKKEAVGAKR
jgi:chaperonin GroES